ncbi:DUF5131 family protein [Paludisphaera sp.]|uniref:DUF5131 family protein n=1 Tax=Paludisphaera sp. TaxID=2017432 RepID=UPI00301BC7FA
MGYLTGIEWCDHTWNPWRGCAHAARHRDGTGEAPECLNCYAEDGSRRNAANLGEWGPGSARAVGVPAYWDLPRKWDRKAEADGVRRRVFFASYADVFEDRADLVPHRRRAFDIIDECPNLDFLVLTKRPEMVGTLWPWGRETRRENVWLGTTCGHPDSLWRVDALLSVRHLAALAFVSAEPLLAPLDFGGRLGGIRWVIAGGESRLRGEPRPCDPEWIRGVAMQCELAGTALFVKQLGGNPVGLSLSHPKGGDMEEWPEDLRIRELPAVAAAGVA